MKIFLTSVEAVSEDLITEYMRLLSPEEFGKYAKKSSLKYLVTRALVKDVLGAELCVEPADIKISVGENGKPYIDNANIYFNLSHSQDFIVLGVYYKDIGIDIEYMRQRNFCAIAESYFGKDIAYEIATSDDIAKAFYTLWTRHEALVKYKGGSIFEKYVPHVVECRTYDMLPNYIFSIACADMPENVELIRKIPLL